MINKIRIYAPYVYISKRTLGGYNLYILVPVEEGKGVQFPLLENLNLTGNTEQVIEVEVTSDSQNIIEIGDNRFAKKHYVLDGLAELEKITISVKNGNASNYKNISRLSNVTDSEALEINDFAANCPYSYLAKKDGYFYPRILIPVNGASYSSEDEELTFEDGICTSSIFLEEGEIKPQPLIVAPDKINTAAFSEDDFEGFEYEVNVNVEETVLETTGGNGSTTAQKKKGKTDKADADTD